MRPDGAPITVGLDGHDGHRDVDRLSGERQRAALAGVLALRPALLLLDEPTSLLDPRGRDHVLTTMNPQRHTTVVLVQHNTVAVRHLVDREIEPRPPQPLLAELTVPWHDLARPPAERDAPAVPTTELYPPREYVSQEPPLSLHKI